MNKKILLITGIIVVVLVAGGIYAVTTKKDSNSTGGSSANSSSFNANIKQACEVLTQEDAKAVLGESASAGVNTTDTSTDDINVSNCTYTNTATRVQDIKTVSVLARAAKTDTGADSNKHQFEGGKPADAQTVSGYGDAAYWSPEFGQFNILKNNNWYILTNGGTRAAENSLEDAKKLADIIKNKL